MVCSVDLNQAENALLNVLADALPIAVAFSGGVDSAVLAKGAVIASEKNPLLKSRGILAVSPTSSADDIENAHRAAEEIGIPLTVIETGEFSHPEFFRNGRDRCYHCKKLRFTEMLQTVQSWETEAGLNWTLFDGENADDLSAYRPGHRAAAELGVRSPIAELGIRKETVRSLARMWGLSVADRPSTPCLMTRFAYGLSPTSKEFRQVEKAEAFLRAENFSVCRVRVDLSGTARIEVPAEDIPRFLDAELRKKIIANVKAAGFSAVSVDLEGFISGKMDRLSFHTKG